MKYPKHPGVYAIRHVDSGRAYIGSSKNIYNRWRDHKSQLRRGIHANSYLQRSWCKYGECAFQFIVLESCLNDPILICHREQIWIDRYNGNIYNLTDQAIPGFSRKLTDEHREKLSARMIGNKNGANQSYCGVLTSDDILRIMHQYGSGDTVEDIARKAKVSETNIHRIVRRLIWDEVELPPDVESARLARLARPRDPSRNGRRRLTWEKVDKIRHLYCEDGIGCRELSVQFGVSEQMIHRVVKDQSWVRPLDLPLITSTPPSATALDGMNPKLKRGYFERRPTTPRPPKVIPVIVTCRECGTETSRLPKRIAAHKDHYCSRKCSSIGNGRNRKGRKNPHPSKYPGSGIFAFIHLPTRRHYVGKAVKLVGVRCSNLRDLRIGKHHNAMLQNAFNDDGAESMEWKVLEFVTDRALLLERQQYWIDELRAADPSTGFNILKVAGSRKDLAHKPETVEKMRRATTERMKDPAVRMRASATQTGKKASEATKAKMSAAQQARAERDSRFTPEDKSNIRKLIAEGQSISSVSRRYACERATIRRIRDESEVATT